MNTLMSELARLSEKACWMQMFGFLFSVTKACFIQATFLRSYVNETSSCWGCCKMRLFSHTIILSARLSVDSSATKLKSVESKVLSFCFGSGSWFFICTFMSLELITSFKLKYAVLICNLRVAMVQTRIETKVKKLHL